VKLRQSVRMLATCAILSVTCARPVAADWQFAPLIGLTFKGSTTLLDLELAAGHTRWNFGAAVTFAGAGPIGAEALFIYTTGFLDDKERSDVTNGRTLALMGNIVVAPSRRWNEYGLRPFVSGGLGLLHTAVDERFDLLSYRNNLLGYNVGGGAVGFVTDTIGLRFELRYLAQLGPGAEGGAAFGRARLRYWVTTIGVVFR
jgi:hypothetical protein